MITTASPYIRRETPISFYKPKIKVIGLGGGGCNAVNRMIELGLSGVDYICANTDAQALKDCLADTVIQLGPGITRGLGSGGTPVVGQNAAEESYSEISKALSGADMVFLTAGMGGGTGTGAIPVVAKIARSLGAVTVGIVTTPFSFEMGRRQRNALEGLSALRKHTDTLITIPNDRLLKVASKDLPLELAFRLADDILRQGIQGITELITQPGLINVDFSHIKTMMLNGGGSLLSIGYGQGPDKAVKAVEQAIQHPLLDYVPLENATGIIANFTGGPDLSFLEVAEALTLLQSKTNQQVEIVPGIITNDSMQDRAEIILIITGLGATAVESGAMSQRQVSSEPRNLAPDPAINPAAPAMTLEPEPEALQPTSDSMHFDTNETAASLEGYSNDLDVPAFLRRRFK